ncbi:MAG: hypothetical protein LBQ97_04940 [Fusobacteriaceae bacterium]|nr:hypothetical protein [Fusobacteriaceae bacterium]
MSNHIHGKGGYAGKIILLVAASTVFAATTLDLQRILPAGVYAKVTGALPFLKSEKETASAETSVPVEATALKTEETEPVAENPKTEAIVKNAEVLLNDEEARIAELGEKAADIKQSVSREKEQVAVNIREETEKIGETIREAEKSAVAAIKEQTAAAEEFVEEEIQLASAAETKANILETAPNKTEIAAAEAEKTEIPKAVSDVCFTKNASVKVYDNPENLNKVADTLTQAMKVKLLEKKEVITESEKRTKGADGKVVVEKVQNSANWEKISYKKNNKERSGWIREDNLTDDFHSLFPESWKDLSFARVEKLEYASNPKREVKGIYVSSSSAGLASRMEKLIALTQRTSVNAFVIDVKDDSGHLLFKMDGMEKYSADANKYTQIKDMAAFMQKLKENNIYTIARIVSFRDPAYAKTNPGSVIINKNTKLPYTNDDKLSWISPHDRTMWEYNVAVAKEAAKAGFNEIQFDYVRFPAADGGKLDKNIDYRNKSGESKPVAIQRYLQYARNELSAEGVYLSADVFGQIGSILDDMQIGQFWEAISNETDYISPMMYPSHYKKGVYGIAVPDKDPYNIIYRGARDAGNRNENLESPAAIRPWLQAFTAKWLKEYQNYGYDEIELQIMALADLGIKEYILWNPSNSYAAIEKNPPVEEAASTDPASVKTAEKTPEKTVEKTEVKKETKIDLTPTEQTPAKPAAPEKQAAPAATPPTPAKPATPAAKPKPVQQAKPKAQPKPAPATTPAPTPAAQTKPAGVKLIDRYKKAIGPKAE